MNSTQTILKKVNDNPNLLQKHFASSLKSFLCFLKGVRPEGQDFEN
jgi:hypothetical protein